MINSYPVSLLQEAQNVLAQRGKQRDDTQTGERSMAHAVGIFNAVTGGRMLERDGWLFMVCLKLARSRSSINVGNYDQDDYIDLLGYTSLLAECVAGPAKPQQSKDAS